MRALLPIAALFSLTACGAPPEESEPGVEHHGHDNADKPAKGGAAPDMIPEVADDAQGTGQAGKDVATEENATLIPAGFRGVWDYEGGTCARESDLRIDVSGREIVFYEAVGAVMDITDESAGLLVKLAMEGEGEEWTHTARLTLEGEGGGEVERLHVTDGNEPFAKSEFPKKRCEG